MRRFAQVIYFNGNAVRHALCAIPQIRAERRFLSFCGGIADRYSNFLTSQIVPAEVSDTFSILSFTILYFSIFAGAG
jgi:hypothetical protein